MKASRSATIDVLGFGNDQGDFPTNVAFDGRSCEHQLAKVLCADSGSIESNGRNYSIALC